MKSKRIFAHAKRLNPGPSLLFSWMRSRRVRKPIATLLYSVLLTSPLGVCAGPVAQSPLFVSPPVPADVVFLLDDSGSMNTYSLPMPKGIDLSRYGALATFADGSTYPVSYWLQESPVLNPLWYNPAITYLPWNNDNGTATFPNADFGGRSQVADLSHLTQQDMRYVVANGSRVRVNPGTGTIGPDSDLDVPLPASIIKTLNLSASATAHYPLMALGSEPSGADLFSRVPASTQAACRIALPCPSYITPPPVFDPATETISQGAPYCSQTPSCPTQDVYFVTAPPSGAPAGYFLWDGVPGTSNDSTHYTPVEVARYKGSATARANASANVTGNVYAPRDTNGQRVSRSDCVTNRATTGTCTFTEEAQNFANWYTYYRTRLFAAIAVTSQAMSTFNDADHSALRVGYGQINYFTGQPSPWDPNAASSNLAPPTSIDGAATAGALVRGVRPFTPQSTDRQQVFDWLFGLSAYGQTPSREALDAIGRYYTRSDTAGPWGDTPGSSTSQTISAASASTSSLNGCRRAYTILTTDGEWTSGNANDPSSRQPILGVSAATPGTAVPGLDTAGATPLSSVTVANATTISGAGADVDRTFVYKPVAFPDVTPASIGPNSANGDSNPPGNTDKTLTSVAMYYWNRDLLPKTPNALQIGDGSTDPAFWQHMSTFAVAYGLSAPEDTPANRAIVSTNNAAIAAGSSSTASINWPAVDTSTGLETGGNRIDDVFRATMASGGNFYSAANPQQLAGDIASAFAQFATVTASGTSVGAPGVNVFAGNQVFTASFKTQVWTGSVNAYEAASYVNALAANQIPAPQWSASIPTRRTLLTTTDPTSGTRAFSSSTPALLQRFGGNSTLINYLLGDRSLEGNPYRVRAGLLGDIVDSSPYYSGIIDYGYAAQPAGNGGGSIYTAYLAKIATRAPMVYAGANDGIWHAFAAKDGQEIFGYVPRAVLPTNTSGTDGIASLAASSYVHQFFVDGPTTESDVWSPSANSWSRVAVGSDGAGPASLFAFDTTYLQYGGANTVKWKITGTENSSLGHNPGAGVIGSSRNALPGGASSFIYVNGNGFDSAQGTASLLVIDAAQGSVLRQIVVDSNSGSGLGPVSVIYDAARNITTAYAGDLKGQLWKFDLSASTASNWKVANNGKPIFRATQGPPYQPITVAPRLSVNASGGYSISFGSGKLFEIGDNTNVDAQAIYSIVDNNGGGVTITPSQLTQLSLSSNGNGGYNIVTPATVSALGFALKLTALPGERIIRPAVINGGQVDFTSYAPSDPAGTLCGPSAASLFYQLSLATGTGVASPVAGSVGGYTLLQLQPANSGSASASGSTPLSNSPAVGILPSAWSSSSAATRKCVGAGTSVSATNTSSNPQCPSVPLLRVWRQPLRTP